MRLVCEECGRTDERGEGWRAYIVPAGADEEHSDEPEGVAIYCLACAEREFARAGETWAQRLGDLVSLDERLRDAVRTASEIANDLHHGLRETERVLADNRRYRRALARRRLARSRRYFAKAS